LTWIDFLSKIMVLITSFVTDVLRSGLNDYTSFHYAMGAVEL